MAQTKTIKDLKNLAGTSSAPYPNLTVKVKVVKVGHSANFTSSSGEDMTILNFSVADSSDCIIATLNEAKRFKLVTEGKSLHLRNFILRNGKIVLTKMSKIMICGPVDVPLQMKQQAEYLISPPSPRKSVTEIRNMPIKSNVTLVGKIVKDEGIRKVKVGGTEADIHTIKVHNDGQEINVSLWRDMSKIPVHVGQFVEVTHCITGEWQGQTQLNSSRNTKITEVDMPEENMKGTVEGLSIDNSTIDLAVQTAEGNYEDLVVDKDLFLASLPGLETSDEDALEEALIEMIPFHVNLTTKGTEVSSIEIEAGRPE